MQITQVKIRKNENSKLVATASVTLDGVFVVHDFKVVNGEKGLFVSMPSRKKGDGDYVDTAHPIDADFRNTLIDAILEEYNKA